MRNTVAKRIRRQARKEAATSPTKYNTKWYQFWTGKTNDKGQKVMDVRGTVIATGYRRIYQDMKRKYTRGEGA